MNRIKLSRVLAGCLTLFTTHAFAAYVWLDRDASGGAKAYFGELNGKKETPSTLSSPRAYLADVRDLGLTPEPEAFSIATPTGGDMRFVARTVSDKGTVQYYYARFGRSETKAVNDLELVPTEANGNIFKLVWKGSTVAVSQVNVSTAEGWSRVLKQEADGTVKLPISFPGLYVLEVSVKVNGAVSIDGKKYDDARHTATLSFIVDAKNK